jgi:AcrR family transcriptional regulator
LPYTPEHRARSKQKIAEAARKQFNIHGFDGVSIKQVMHAAGLSHGGFYHHFDNKDALFAEAVASFSALMHEQVDADTAPSGNNLVAAILEGYLSDAHLNNQGNDCPMIAVPSDVARSGEAAKQSYQQVFETMLQTFESNLENGSKHAKRNAALTLSILSIGGMVLARSLKDDALIDEIRHIARSAPQALGIADQDDT